MRKVNFQRRSTKPTIVADTTPTEVARAAKAEFTTHPTNGDFVQIKPRDRANFHFKPARDKSMAK